MDPAGRSSRFFVSLSPVASRPAHLPADSPRNCQWNLYQAIAFLSGTGCEMIAD
jgi:hypothetical protein